MAKRSHGNVQRPVAGALVSAVCFVPRKKKVGEAMNERMGKRKRRRLAAKGLLPRKKPQRYFHGGNFGLQIGEYVLPPSVTGVPQNGNVSPDIRRDDRIYMVKLFDQAAIWAAHHECASANCWRASDRPDLYQLRREMNERSFESISEAGNRL